MDWRNVKGVNLCSHTLTQQAPNVCGSCWAEAVSGALSDRYVIATGGQVRTQLAPQTFINFNEPLTGGTCNGGDAVKAYEFVKLYGIVDDTCAPFLGLNWARGFDTAAMTDYQQVRHERGCITVRTMQSSVAHLYVCCGLSCAGLCMSDQVRDHQCYKCNWDGTCTYQAESSGSGVNLYGAESFGSVVGEQQMMAEIALRGPIACLINSDAPAFDQYTSGIITCPPSTPACLGVSDHYVVIAGYGVDATTGLKYWIGRNSYGTNWGANGWFKIQRGAGTLNIDTDTCAWAVPNATDVGRVMAQFKHSL